MPPSDHIVWKIVILFGVLAFVGFQLASANSFDADEYTNIGILISTVMAALWAKSPAPTK